MTARGVLLVTGCLAAGYGVTLLLGNGWSDVVAAGIWLAAGVFLHDAVLAPVTIGLGALALGRWRAPLAMGLVLLGTLTLVAVPVLSGQGERPDNPTLLDRNYVAGWCVVAAVVAVAVLVARHRASGHEQR